MATAQENLLRLIGRTALRDRSAFQALYTEASPQVFSMLLRMLNRSELAEEALQDTFLRVWERASEYHSGRGQVTTWISSIARYRALDIMRARKDIARATDFDDTMIEDDGKSTLDVKILSNDANKLGGCLQRLTHEQKQSIALAFYRGLTHGEAAEQLNVPVGTAKSWIRRGLKSLKECMQR